MVTTKGKGFGNTQVASGTASSRVLADTELEAIARKVDSIRADSGVETRISAGGGVQAADVLNVLNDIGGVVQASSRKVEIASEQAESAREAAQLAKAKVAEVEAAAKVQLEEAKASVDAAKATAAAEVQAAQADAEAKVAAAKEEVEAATAQAGTLGEELEVVKAEAAAITAKVEEIQAGLAKTDAELKASNEKNTQLTQELEEFRTVAHANEIAFEASGLRERATALVAAKKMTPADKKDIFGGSDEEFAEKVKAMATDSSLLAFASTYIERLERFTESVVASTTTVPEDAEVVEAKLPADSTESSAKSQSVGAKAAALVTARYSQKKKATA